MDATNSVFEEDLSYLVGLLQKEVPFQWGDILESVKVPGSKQQGYSPVYVNKYCGDHNGYKAYDTIHPSLKTLGDMFRLCLHLHGDKDCLGERIYRRETGKFDDYFTFESFNVTLERQKLVGAGVFRLLEENKFRTPDQDPSKFVLTLYSRNRKEWVLTDLACQNYNICNTSLYDTLGPTTSSYILNLTESPIAVCSKDRLDVLLKIKKECPYLISVVCMDRLQPEDEHYYNAFHDLGVQLVDFPYLEDLGRANPIPYRRAKPEDLYTISFTSGTTGNPKGVEIPNSMLIAALCFVMTTLRKTKFKQDYILSFLPLAHIYERMNMFNCLVKGVGIGFPHDGAATSLVENLKILKPTILNCVPRVFSKFEGVLKDKLYDKSFAMSIALNLIHKKEKILATKDDANASMFLTDKIILKKFEQALGVENCQYMVSGSAPMSPETAQFLRLALNVGFAQGYGLTESFAGCAISYPFDKEPGSCGPICLTTEMRLRDIPEMNYYSTVENDEHSKGELLLRGPQIFSKYFKNPDLTKDLIDEDGWFHTGDVARIDHNGKLYIIDRVKNFFKLAQGEYITPERIENSYLSQCPALTQLYIHGDSTQNFLVAIAGVDILHLQKIVRHRKLGRELLDLDETALIDLFNSNLKLKKSFVEDLNRGVRYEGLQGFEKLQNVHLAIEPLTVQDDVVTPTMKIKRAIAKKFFAETFEKLYKEGSLIKNAKL